MRLRIFGISRLLLVLFGLFPLFLWCAFHIPSILYRREEAYWALGIGVGVAVGFSLLLARGGFWIRRVWAGLVLLELFSEIFPAVLERDFIRMGGVLLAFLLAVFLGLWVERSVVSASLNPEAFWFEGVLRGIPRVSARVRSGSEWFDARLRRIDEKGLFLLTDAPLPDRKPRRVEFELEYQGQKVAGEGRGVSLFSGESPGFGLQFLPKDLYHFQQYTAWVRRLRGEGL
jgi:hypothetical protein